MQLDFDLKGTTSKPKPAPKPAEPVVLTVTALTRKVRGLLEEGIGEVWVTGEISNLRRQASGHAYFTLKDSGSQIACVLFAGQTAQLRSMNFADGVQVQIQGALTVYEPRGNYQIIVSRIQERGVGALQTKFEELKRRLNEEGLFNPEKKRPLPKFPRRIGVVTSPTGAAIQDFLNVLHRRQKGIEVVIFPVRVQGKGAAAEIAEAIRFLGDASSIGLEPFDVLVVTRGGGSLEDLWEFNEEAVARAVAASPIPVVSAVGHEIDFSICDFAADFRAPTPSAAAEILSADSGELLDKLQHFTARLGRPLIAHFNGLRSQLLSFQRTALFFEPRRLLQEKQQTLDRFFDDLVSNAESIPNQIRLRIERHAHILADHRPDFKISTLANRLALHRETLDRLANTRLCEEKAMLERHSALLRTLSPSSALARGYTITMDASGRIVRSVRDALQSQEVTTRFHDGEVKSKINPPREAS